MEEFCYEFIEYMIATFKKTSYTIDDVKFVLTTHFKRNTLMYQSQARTWLKQFFDIIQRLGLGYYDVGKMELILNVNHNKIILWLTKYGVGING